MDISKRVKELKEEIIGFRRDLHSMPELGNEVPKTTAYIAKELDKLNISYKTIVNGSGIVAMIGKNENGKVVAIRADTDALPVRETTGAEYSADSDCMHACGHDAHAAMTLGAAKVLKEMEDSLKGRVKIIFQPGEETLSGAKAVIEEGALENPKPDSLLALHVSNMTPQVPVGSIIGVYGTSTASSDSFIVTVTGRGGHAAFPQTAIDPIVILAQIIDALQRIVSRETDPNTCAVVTVSGVRAGNDSFNVIPNDAELRGTFRTIDKDVRALIAKRIKEISCGISESMGATCNVQIIEGVPSLVNDKHVLDTVFKVYDKLTDKKMKIVYPQPSMGGEDAAYLFEKIPGAYVLLSTTFKVDGEVYPHHNPKFGVDDSVLYIGTDLLVQSAIELLN